MTVITVEQYRCLVAHMNYWKFGIKSAMTDLGIDGSKIKEVIAELWAAGHRYHPPTDQIYWHEDQFPCADPNEFAPI